MIDLGQVSGSPLVTSITAIALLYCHSAQPSRIGSAESKNPYPLRKPMKRRSYCSARDWSSRRIGRWQPLGIDCKVSLADFRFAVSWLTVLKEPAWTSFGQHGNPS